MDCRESRSLDRRPAVHHLLVTESEHAEASAGELSVSSSVALEGTRALMERSAVHLDDERLTDEEVHAADPGDLDLAPQARNPVAHAESEERLDA